MPSARHDHYGGAPLTDDCGLWCWGCVEYYQRHHPRRPDGYYWVQSFAGDWRVARWTNGRDNAWQQWAVTGSEVPIQADEWAWIGLRLPAPDEAPGGASTMPHEDVPILRFFTYEHLPPDLQTVSQPFALLARLIAAELPANEERAVALRKLLEAKDAAVRARLPDPSPPTRRTPHGP